MRLKTVKFDDPKMVELIGLAASSVRSRSLKINEAINKIDHILWNYNLRLSKAQKVTLKETIGALAASTFSEAA